MIAAWQGVAGAESRPTLRHGAERTYEELGRVGGARVAVVQMQMGTATAGGSLSTLKTAIREVSPSSIIMVGIAFGVSQEKQPIGTVLVAEKLQQYEIQRVGTTSSGERQRISRGDKATSSPTIINRLRTANRDKPAQYGLVLSGEKLIDNVESLRELLLAEPEAIGGEMEGSGLYVAATEGQRAWCMVKAVCDWADGNKGVDKETRQETAARSAADYVMSAIRAGGFTSGADVSTEAKPKVSYRWLAMALVLALTTALILSLTLSGGGRDERKADVVMEVYPGDSPRFSVMNRGQVRADSPRFGGLLIDMSQRDPSGLHLNLESVWKTLEYILPGNGGGMYSFTGESQRGRSVRMGDVVVGYWTVQCANCIRQKVYWLYLKYGQPGQGWLRELSENESVTEEFISSLIKAPDLPEPEIRALIEKQISSVGSSPL